MWQNILMGNSDFCYFPKMLKTRKLLSGSRKCGKCTKIIVISFWRNDAISSHEYTI